MAPTPNKGLPQIALTDNPDVPRDLNALATALDNVANFYYGTLTARNAFSAKSGDYWWVTDDLTATPDGTPYVWRAGAWRIVPAIYTAGNGIAVAGRVISLDLVAGGSSGLEFVGGKVQVDVDDATIERVGGTGLRVKSGGITTAKLAVGIDGDGIAINGAVLEVQRATNAGLLVPGGALALSVDNVTVELNANVLRVKDAGIGNAKMAANAVSTAVLADDAVTPAKVQDTGDFNVNSLDTHTGAWTGAGTNKLSAVKSVTPGSTHSGLTGVRKRFLKMATIDATPRRLSLFYLSRDNANWSLGFGVEVIVRTEYPAGGYTRCLIHGGYQQPMSISVLEMTGLEPYIPRLGVETVVSGALLESEVYVDTGANRGISVEVNYSQLESTRPFSTYGRISFTGTETNLGSDPGTSLAEFIYDPAESRFNPAFGLLTTPDRVRNVYVRPNGTLRVSYWALWKTQGFEVEAAIFIGANQLKARANRLVAGVGVSILGAQSAVLDMTANMPFYTPLVSAPIGLVSSIIDVAGATEAPAPVTTGEAMALAVQQNADPLNFKIFDATTGAQYFPTIRAGDTGSLSGMVAGSECVIHNLATGMYDVSIQFRCDASTGTPGVTVKNRRLRVETR